MPSNPLATVSILELRVKSVKDFRMICALLMADGNVRGADIRQQDDLCLYDCHDHGLSNKR